MTSMGANCPDQWAHNIRNVLCKRLLNGPVNRILAENHPRPAEAVRKALLDGADEEQKQLIEKNWVSLRLKCYVLVLSRHLINSP